MNNVDLITSRRLKRQMQPISPLVAPIVDHACFKKAPLQHLLRNDLFQITCLAA